MPATRTPRSIVQIAHVAHETNRAYQIITGESEPANTWDDTPLTEREKITGEVDEALNGFTAEQMHEAWLLRKLADGWTYGPVKDTSAKTDPCIAAYSDLSNAEHVKDVLFYAVVNALA